MSGKTAADKPSSKTGLTAGAESPTTARELDFDDEPQETGATALRNNVASPSPKRRPRVSFQDEETPPPKPPRPMSPQAQAEATLIEAFPAVDPKVVKAVLLASNGRVEPAFNALLSMSDPDFQQEEAPPPQPPRPTQAQRQLESDEMYARQLAEHYQKTQGPPGYGSRERGNPPLPRQKRETGLKPNELYDKEHSFFEDDLPVIKENLRKGFIETQTTVNKWITDFRKKIEGEDEDEDLYSSRSSASNRRQDLGPSQSQQLYGIRKSAETARRSGDRERYDADHRVLGDDFTALELRDDESSSHKRPGGRPQANPSLFKPTPVAPQSGPVDEVDALYYPQNPTNRQPSPGTNKAKKWQPLTSVAPHPEGDDNDPFSLGDSDDEDAKTRDLRAEDTQRLKSAASEVPPLKSDGGGETLRPAERSGSKDKEMEELLAGKS
ncbi:ubiquitin-binding protein cue5 [Coniosporium apollinis]|uniref:Ubiquitin-binding protein cue5 n=2 Tax=Coniosporium TaxID=2810619 RepID=A0ABQ9P4J9_9PEZI|nr:ubiquitin-binding protein cue5 [Cladosporium sp. JES 115]KAJ9669455.1 ubiquitin-binding protein cue5 [Coniosporium apollinis]